MISLNARLTYIGGPAVLLECEGLRLLTDPTFDPAGTSYALPIYTLRKTLGPAVGSDAVGLLDAILLSHDHHFDNHRSVGSRTSRFASKPVSPVSIPAIKTKQSKTRSVFGMRETGANNLAIQT
jgi:Beta-lactamase superfamily domain